MLMMDLSIDSLEPLLIVLPTGEKLEIRLKKVRGKRRACIGIYEKDKAIKIVGPHIVRKDGIKYESRKEF